MFELTSTNQTMFIFIMLLLPSSPFLSIYTHTYVYLYYACLLSTKSYVMALATRGRHTQRIQEKGRLSYTIPSSSSPLLSIQLIRYLSIHHSADPGPSNSKQSRFCVNARRTGPAYHTPMNYTTTDFNIIQIYV